MIKKILIFSILNFSCFVGAKADEMSPITFNLKYNNTSVKNKIYKQISHIKNHYHKNLHLDNFKNRSSIVNMVIRSALKHGVPIKLALGIAHTESGFRSLSNGKAFGVMQILSPTARSVGCSGSPRNLMNPSYGIECGMRYLSRIYKHNKSSWITAAKYNQGEGARHIVHMAAHYANMVVAFR